MTIDHVLALVADERARQDAWWGKPAERGLSPETWLAILGEEIGEVCTAALAPLGQADGHDLRTELVQVAAVCAAWAEATWPERRSAVLWERARRYMRGPGLCELPWLARAFGILASDVATTRWPHFLTLAHVGGVAVAWCASLDPDPAKEDA